MVYLRIHCYSCGGEWSVYSKLREYDAARTCPHCESRIDGDTWRQKVLPAFSAANAANVALMDDHVNYHTAPFEVDFIADSVFERAKGANINESEW